MNCAYCTLVSNDEYTWGAACLSISKSIINTKYPLVIMVSEIVSEENKKLLSNYGIVKIIPNHIFEYGDNDFYKCTKQKLEVFNLTEYDRVCFLDADMLMLESLDYELENNAFMFDIRERYAKDLNRFAVCGEVFIVTPDSITFDMLIDIADKNKLTNDEVARICNRLYNAVAILSNEEVQRGTYDNIYVIMEDLKLIDRLRNPAIDEKGDK